jgi:hypothetical protein
MSISLFSARILICGLLRFSAEIKWPGPAVHNLKTKMRFVSSAATSLEQILINIVSLIAAKVGNLGINTKQINVRALPPNWISFRQHLI